MFMFNFFYFTSFDLDQITMLLNKYTAYPKSNVYLEYNHKIEQTCKIIKIEITLYLK
jgi:hypothetical protein